jgi:hypothetical protein
MEEASLLLSKAQTCLLLYEDGSESILIRNSRLLKRNMAAHKFIISIDTAGAAIISFIK